MIGVAAAIYVLIISLSACDWNRPNSIEKYVTQKTRSSRKYLSEIRKWEKALKQSPDDDGLYARIGLDYVNLSRQARNSDEEKKYKQKAKLNFEKAIDLNENNIDAVFGLGEYYVAGHEKDLVKALKWYKKCLGLGSDSLDSGDPTHTGSPAQYLATIAKLEKLVAQSPNDDKSYVHMGRAYNLLRNAAAGWLERVTVIQLAKTCFQIALEFNENNFDAYLGLADIYNSAGPAGYGEDLSKALEYFQKCREMESDSSRVLVNMGVCYYRLKKYSEAKEVLNKAVALAENAYMNTFETSYLFDLRKAREHLGRIYTDEGKLDLAENFLKESAEGLDDFNDRNNSTWGCPYQALGRLYNLKGQSMDMAINYIKAAEEQPFTDYLQYEAALYCYKGKYYDLALQYINRAMEITHEFRFKYLKTKILARLKWAEFRGQEAKAIDLAVVRDNDLEPAADFLKALDDYQKDRFDDCMIRVNRILERENNGPAMVLKGFLFLFQKRYDEAKNLFEKAHNVNDTGFGAEVGLGHLKIIERKFERAVHDFRGALKIGNLTFESGPIIVKDDLKYFWFCYEMANLGMGWVNSNTNHHDEAVGFFNRILDVQPQDLMALLGKGNSLIGMKRLAEAEKLYNQLLQTHPRDPFAMAQLALIKLNLGKESDAEELFLKAQNAGDPTYTCPYEGLGLVYLKQGKLDKAKENFKKAIEMDPDIQYQKYNGLAKIYMKEKKNVKAAELLIKSIDNYPFDNEAVTLLGKCAQNLCEANDPACGETALYIANLLADRGEPHETCRVMTEILGNVDVEESWKTGLLNVAKIIENRGFPASSDCLKAIAEGKTSELSSGAEI